MACSGFLLFSELFGLVHRLPGLVALGGRELRMALGRVGGEGYNREKSNLGGSGIVRRAAWDASMGSASRHEGLRASEP